MGKNHLLPAHLPTYTCVATHDFAYTTPTLSISGELHIGYFCIRKHGCNTASKARGSRLSES